MKFPTVVAVVFNQILLTIRFVTTGPAGYVDALKYFPKTKRMSSFAQDVKDYASKYDGFKVHSLEGLNDFLKPVQHCFIHMTNFGGVDLPFLSVPSIQMKTKLAVCADSIYAISSSLDLRKNITSRKDCYQFSNPPPCPLSPLFAKSRRMCVRINFRKFVTKVRPWTCEEQNSVIPFEQNHHSVVRYIERLLPSYTPINILITEKHDELACPQNWKFPNKIGAWFKYSLQEKLEPNRFDSYLISRDTYFVVLTSPIDIMPRFDTFDYQVFKINSVFSLKTMPVPQTHEIHCVSSANIFIQGNDFLMKQKYSALTNMFDAAYIYEFSIGALGKVSEKFLYESICKSRYLKWAAKVLRTSDEAYVVSLIGEWLQILRRFNYTICIDVYMVICNAEHHRMERTATLEVQTSSTLVQSHDEVYPTAISHPLAIDDPGHKLGFISCGNRPIDYLAFRELVRVFDLNVWICVCIIYLTIVPITFCILEWLSEDYKLNGNVQGVTIQNVFSSRIFLQPITILLEQGSAFTNKHLNVTSTRWIAAAVILVAIVLSNAYKYDNVYNMMLPRKASPLWFFEQILSANFTAYTRTNVHNILYQGAWMTYNENSALRNIVQSDHTITFIDENSNSQIIQSEVEIIYRIERTSLIVLSDHILKPWVANNSSSSTLKIFSKELGDYLLRNTKLHPYEKQLAKLRRFDYSVFDLEPYENSKKALDNGQTNYLSHLLIECNNTSIVLPLSKIQKLLSKIQNLGHTKLSVGKEILLDRKIGLALNGWISDHLITTISRMQDAALWQHIRNIFVRNITTAFDGSKDFNYQTSQISGNILVVFVTFLCGHGVAALSFIFEIRKRIYIWTTLIVQSAYTGLARIWSQAKVMCVCHRNGCRLISRSTAKCCRMKR
ncbi:unnamed protein product [Orchesella dallaii]|uniref:Uncharacterized protein n=1 Tax=Orchesella dallaii TaxID=48710 RepID=A0ABP1S8S6_9HEXA